MGNEASTGNIEDEGMGLQSSGSRTIDNEVRRRLARGVQYNIKIVIRGDRNTGKTQLWRRLQGQQFSAAYTPTDQIQIATINWNYKMSSDVIKLDAWDVVDRAPKRKNQAGLTDSGLKIANTQAFDASELNGDDYGDDEERVDEDGVAEGARQNEFGIGSVVPNSPQSGSPQMVKNGSYSVGALDASVVDVMRGATGCILMFDMTKKWTWDYVTRELPKVVKKGIHVLVVGNFRDMGESGRVVSTQTAEAFCLTAGENVHYVEASMKNGYGVRAIASFFSLPFLALQKKYIDEQLRRNLEEKEAALTEIKALSQELTYDLYLRQLADRKAAKKTPPPKKEPPPPPQQQAEPEPPASPKQEKEKPKEKERPTPVKTTELPTAVDAATLKRIQQEEKQREKEAKARQEEEKRKAKEDEKRRKEEARKAEEYRKSHAKELEAKRKKQAEEDAAAAEELKRLAASSQRQSSKNTSTPTSSLTSVDDFKITDNDGWLSKSMDSAADDDGWLVTPEGKNTGKADPFAFGADDDDDGAFGLGGGKDDDDEVVEEKPKSGKKKGKKGGHKQAFLADTDDL